MPFDEHVLCGAGTKLYPFALCVPNFLLLCTEVAQMNAFTRFYCGAYRVFSTSCYFGTAIKSTQSLRVTANFSLATSLLLLRCARHTKHSEKKAYKNKIKKNKNEIKSSQFPHF